MKIVAVEDDPVALTVLHDTLGSLGHQVFAASDGAQAWARLHENDCRIVVSDWTMPELDGLELCRRIRAKPGDYVYFILLTSAAASTKHRESAMEAGVDDFLSKPLDREEMTMRLHVAQRILQFTTRIQKLEALIPICSYCKNVRDDQSYWKRIEDYLSDTTGALCSHSVCPSCYEKHVIPQFEELGIKPKPRAQTTAPTRTGKTL